MTERELGFFAWGLAIGSLIGLLGVALSGMI